MPGARCARSLVCEINKHTSIVTTVTPERPGIPYAMVLTVSFALSLVTGLVVTIVKRITPPNLTPASGRQDHTTSPSALVPFVKGTISVHRTSDPTTVTIAIRPSVGRDGLHRPLIWVRWEEKYF
jgi:hypothetical protein